MVCSCCFDMKKTKSTLSFFFSFLCLISVLVLWCIWTQINQDQFSIKSQFEKYSKETVHMGIISKMAPTVSGKSSHTSGRNNSSNIQIIRATSTAVNSVVSTAPSPIGGPYSHYWRTIDNSKNVQLKLFSAYYDDRVEAAIYLLGFENHNANQKYYCVFGYEDGDSLCQDEPARREKGNDDVDPFKDYNIIFWAFYYICKLPTSSVPVKASLSLHSDCAMKSDKDWLPVNNRVKPDKSLVKRFAVCLHSPVYNVKSPQYMVEFLELHRALGAELITIYIQDADKLVWNVLEQYEREGLVEVFNWNLSFIEDTGYYHYNGQSLLVLDCMYRNMHRVEYLAMNDLDEAIVPQGNLHTWSDMLPSIKERDSGALQFSDASFTSHVQPLSEENLRCRAEINSTIKAIDQPRFATRTERSIINGRQKLMIRPQCLKTVSFHFSFSMLDKYYVSKVPVEIALLYHFRVPALSEKGHVVKDNRLMTLFPTVVEKIRERVCSFYAH